MNKVHNEMAPLKDEANKTKSIADHFSSHFLFNPSVHAENLYARRFLLMGKN